MSDERREDFCKCGAPCSAHFNNGTAVLPGPCPETKCEGYRHDGGEARPAPLLPGKSYAAAKPR